MNQPKDLFQALQASPGLAQSDNAALARMQMTQQVLSTLMSFLSVVHRVSVVPGVPCNPGSSGVVRRDSVHLFGSDGRQCVLYTAAIGGTALPTLEVKLGDTFIDVGSSLRLSSLAEYDLAAPAGRAAAREYVKRALRRFSKKAISN